MLLYWVVQMEKFGSGITLYRLVFGVYRVLWSICTLVWQKLSYLLSSSYSIISEPLVDYCRLVPVIQGVRRGVYGSPYLTSDNQQNSSVLSLCETPDSSTPAGVGNKVTHTRCL